MHRGAWSFGLLVSTASWVLVGLASSGCASAFAGAPTAFVYRQTAVRESATSCDPSAAANTADATTDGFFVVRDFGPLAKVWSCPSEDLCRAIAAGSASASSVASSWSVTVASFSFAPSAPASGPCTGLATTAFSTAIGAPTIAIDVLERTLTDVPRETDGTCSAEYAASKAPTLPCTKATRHEGALLASY